MKSSEILREARKLIASGKEKHICIAVSLVTRGDGNCYTSDRHPIINYIANSLHPFGTLVSWQYNNLPDFSWDRDFQTDRLAWIDWMIAAYEEKGDCDSKSHSISDTINTFK